MPHPEPYVLMERERDGVLTLVRVPGAVPVSRDWVAGVGALLDSLDAPRPRGEARGERRDETPGMGS